MSYSHVFCWIACFWLILISSCFHNESSVKNLFEYYASGQVKIVSKVNAMNGDTVFKTSFYESGNVKSFYNYKNGKKHGVAQGYYPNGAISAILNYKGGRLNGEQHWYYDNNCLSRHAYFENDTVIGEEKQFHDNEILSQFVFNLGDGNILYESQYSEEGLLIGDSGFIFYRADAYYDTLNLTVGDSVLFKCSLIKAPRTDDSIYLVLFSGQKEYDFVQDFKKIDSRDFQANQVLGSEGTYVFGIVSTRTYQDHAHSRVYVLELDTIVVN